MARLEDARRIAADSVDQLTILSNNCPGTPRWRRHLESTITICHEITHQESGDADLTINNIGALFNDLGDHWRLVFSTPFDTARMYTQMTTFETFLRAKLLEDYTDKRPPPAHDHIVVLGKCKGNLASRERAAKTLGKELTDLEEFYQKSVDLPVQELTLDPHHVESKFRAAAAREGKPGSDIKPLIDQCSWTKLAEALVKDRIMADALFSAQGADDHKLYDRVIGGINRIQNKLFDRLTNPSRFVISARARALATKAANARKKRTGRDLPPRYDDVNPDPELELGPSSQSFDEKKTVPQKS